MPKLATNPALVLGGIAVAGAIAYSLGKGAGASSSPSSPAAGDPGFGGFGGGGGGGAASLSDPFGFYDPTSPNFLGGSAPATPGDNSSPAPHTSGSTSGTVFPAVEDFAGSNPFLAYGIGIPVLGAGIYGLKKVATATFGADARAARAAAQAAESETAITSRAVQVAEDAAGAAGRTRIGISRTLDPAAAARTGSSVEAEVITARAASQGFGSLPKGVTAAGYIGAALNGIQSIATGANRLNEAPKGQQGRVAGQELANVAANTAVGFGSLGLAQVDFQTGVSVLGQKVVGAEKAAPRAEILSAGTVSYRKDGVKVAQGTPGAMLVRTGEVTKTYLAPVNTGRVSIFGFTF